MNTQQLIDACQTQWQAYTQHEFVKQLAAGTLAKKAYLDYLQQDYLFLKHYARAYALLVYKSTSLTEMRQPLPSLDALINCEMSHHVEYCQTQGLNADELELIPESAGTVAYTRYVLDIGVSADRVSLLAALAPCALGYAEIGRQLNHHLKNEAHPFHDWICVYAADEFQQGAMKSLQQLDNALAEIDINSQQGQRLIQIFDTATRMEAAFWQQSLVI